MTTTPITGETWGDEIEKPRAFIQAQAQQPFPALRADFEQAYEALTAGLQGVSETQAAFKPGRGDGEEDYSIAEVTRHLIHVSGLMALRIAGLAHGQESPPSQGPGTLGEHQGVSVSQLTRLLAEAKAGLIEQVKAVEGKEDLAPTMPHRLFGELNCRGWLAMTVLHFGDHARQIAKVKAHPDYPGA
jgi:hypothetical protein